MAKATKSKLNKKKEITGFMLPWGYQPIGPGTVPSHGKTDWQAIKRDAQKEGIWDTDKDGYYGGPIPQSE